MKELMRHSEDMAKYLEGQAEGMLWALDKGVDAECALRLAANTLMNAAKDLWS